jgi:hypothetical protein
MTPFSKKALLLSLTGLLLGCAAADSAEPSADEAQPVVQEASQALTSPGYGSVAWEELSPAPPGGALSNLKANLPLLQGRGVALVLHWPSTKLSDAARWDIVSDARARGIPVYPWLTLPNGSDADNAPGSAN